MMCAAGERWVRDEQCIVCCVCVGYFYQLVPKPVQGIQYSCFSFLNTGRAVNFITWATVAGKYMGFQLRSKAVQRCSFK